jgi:cobalt-zinc-cadmium efflux system protein
VALTGWSQADAIVSIVLSLMILVGAWSLLKESTNVLLESAPANVPLDQVRATLIDVAGVADVHDLHVWTVTSGVVAMSGHAVVPDLETHPVVLKAMLERLEKMGIQHATMQLEIHDHCEGLDCLRREPAAAHDHSHAHSH